MGSVNEILHLGAVAALPVPSISTEPDFYHALPCAETAAAALAAASALPK